MRTMRTRGWVGLGVTLAAFAGQAGVAHGQGGNQRAPAYLTYPRGSDLRQEYGKPANETDGNLTAFAAAAAGMVSHAASASVVAAQPILHENELTPLPGSGARVDLGPARPGDANLVGAPSRALWRYSYHLQHKGVPLSKFSGVSHVVEASGTSTRTLYIRSTNLPNKATLPSTTANVAPAEALRLGREDARKDLPEIDPQVGPAGREILVGPDGSSELVWSFLVQAKDPARIFARNYWVSARGQAKIVRKEDLIYLESPQGPEMVATATGKVTANIHGLGKSPLDPPDLMVPLQDYRGTISSITNAAGVYNAAGTINTRLLGPFANISNQAGSPLVPIKAGNDLYFKAASEADLAQATAFYWVNSTHEFVRPFLPASPTVLMNNTVNVNLSQRCNAFWRDADKSLNFFNSGGGCQNSAYCDVVCHEYGHGIDSEFGGIRDGGYSEGFGDSVAILITHGPIIGKDFQGAGVPLRLASEVHPWPPADPEVHEVGKIYNGFTWQLTRELLKTNTEAASFAIAKDLILGAAALNPKDIPDAVRLSFFVDAKAGSKHFNELAAAADSRQIPRPTSPVTSMEAESLLAEK